MLRASLWCRPLLLTLTLELVASLPSTAGSAPALTPPEEALLAQCTLLEKRFDRRTLIYHEAKLEEHLATIARDLIPKDSAGYIHWQFLVLRDPLVTTFSLPNGTVYVSTGLLSVLENDDQLAAVLAHEIAHVVNRDAFRTLAEYRKREGTRSVLRITANAASFASPATAIGLYAASGLGSHLILVQAAEPLGEFAISGYGDAAERGADVDACQMLTGAQRHPQQLVRALELMAERRDPEPLMCVHADAARLRERAGSLERNSAIAPAPAMPGQQYVEIVEGALRENVQLNIDSRRFRTAVSNAQRLVLSHPADANAVYLLAHAYSALGPRTTELSNTEQHAALHELRKHTAEEEERDLEANPAGREALRTNRKRAEELFLEAIRLAPQFAEPHRDLAQLYEKMGRGVEARTEYRRFLELAPQSPYRSRIETRLAALEAAQAGK